MLRVRAQRQEHRFADEESHRGETRVCLSCAEGGGGGAARGGAGGSRHVSPLGGRTSRALGPPSARRSERRRDTLFHRAPRSMTIGPSSPGISIAPYDAYSISSRGGDASLDPDGGGDVHEGAPSLRRRRSITTRAVRARTTTPLGSRGARRSRRRSGGSRRSAVSLLDPNGSSSQRSPPSPGAGLWFGATARALPLYRSRVPRVGGRVSLERGGCVSLPLRVGGSVLGGDRGPV